MPFYGSSAPVAANASSPATRTPFPPGPQAARSKPKSTWKNATLGSSQLSMRGWERAGTHGLRGTVGRFRFQGSWRLRALRLLRSLRIHSQERIPTTTRTTTAHTCSRYRRLRPHQHTPLPHRRPRISRTRLPGPEDAVRLGLMLLRGLGGTASRPRLQLHRPTPTPQRTSSRALKLGRGRGQGAKSRF